MRSHKTGLASFLLAAITSQSSARPIDESKFSPSDIITRDVAVIGGGASGSHAAVRIRDFGKTVVVVEQSDHLGGHVDTYTDPTTHAPIDHGVLAYLDLPGVKEFFARFNVTLETGANPPFVNQYIDFSTGKSVAGYPSADENTTNTALGVYAQVCAQYVDYLFPGYDRLPAAVPDDLAMPFGQFAQKYSIQGALPIMSNFISGVGNMLETSTMIIMQNFGAPHIQALTSGGFLVPTSHNNSMLYGAMQEYLRADVLFSSKVSASSRESSGIKLVVKGPGGSQKLIKAKRLLVTIPPTESNMYPFDLDTTESGLFSKWQWQNIFVGVFSRSGLPDGLTLYNTSPDGSPASFNLPRVPFVWLNAFSGVPGLYRTFVVGDEKLNMHQAKEMVRDSINKLAEAQTFPTRRLDFETFSSHSTIQMRPSEQELRAGFYKKLYALQGKRNTWYTGNAWTSDYTSTLWVYSETVLPKLLAGI